MKDFLLMKKNIKRLPFNLFFFFIVFPFRLAMEVSIEAIDSVPDVSTVVIVLYLFMIFIVFCLYILMAVQRFYDMGKPGYTVLFQMIPIYGFYLLILLMFKKSLSLEEQNSKAMKANFLK